MKNLNEKGGVLKVILYTIVVFFTVIILMFVGCSMLVGTAANQVVKNEQTQLEEAITKPVSNITWEEINKIYNLKSEFTDLQKNEYWKNYEGKKVKWTGTVTSISGSLSLQVKLNPDTWTSDVLVRLKDKEKDKVLSIKEKSIVTFIGVLDDWGTLMPITLNYGEIVQ